MAYYFQVDLTKVANALHYTNVQSVGNRYRQFRKKYGVNLNCVSGSGALVTKAGDANAASAEADADEAEKTPVKTPVKTPRKPRARKGAKVSSDPIPATAGDSDGDGTPKTKTPRRGRKPAKESLKDSNADALQSAIDDTVENMKKRTQMVKKESEDEDIKDSEQAN